jgi:hypothetical protein
VCLVVCEDEDVDVWGGVSVSVEPDNIYSFICWNELRTVILKVSRNAKFYFYIFFVREQNP